MSLGCIATCVFVGVKYFFYHYIQNSSTKQRLTNTAILGLQVLSRYEARLSGPSEGHSKVPQTSMAANEQQNQKYHKKIHNGRDNQSPQNQTQYWWRLNNINCNLHDIPSSVCSGLNISQCQHKCQHEVPDCGGFLYYSKTDSFALK